jgi:hypothetical protein
MADGQIARPSQRGEAQSQHSHGTVSPVGLRVVELCEQLGKELVGIRHPESGGAGGDDGVLVAFVDEDKARKEPLRRPTPGLGPYEKGPLSTGGDEVDLPVLGLEYGFADRPWLRLATTGVTRRGCGTGGLAGCDFANNVDGPQVERSGGGS